MSGSGSTTFDWGDGRYTFRLDIGDLRELQENPNIGVGPIALFHRIMNDTWMADDIPEVLRLALLRGSNGAMEPVRAQRLVQRYYHEAPKVGGKQAALRILHAYLAWPEDDPVGKEMAAMEKRQSNRAATKSPSPPSTEEAGT